MEETRAMSLRSKASKGESYSGQGQQGLLDASGNGEEVFTYQKFIKTNKKE